MGQGESTELQVTPDQLSLQLAAKFAQRCFTQLELYHFKEVFSRLADSESDLRYWSEGTLCRFLAIPDAHLTAGPVVHQMATFLGAFPFASQAPSILTFEAMVKVVTIMTERYTRVLKKGHRDRLRLFYSSMAVFDRRNSLGEAAGRPRPAASSLAASTTEKRRSRLGSQGHRDAETILEGDEGGGDHRDSLEELRSGVTGFAVDEAVNDDDDDGEDDEEDDLALAALDSLDAIQVIGLGERPNMHHSLIPSDNLLRLVELLLLLAPLQPQESLSQHAQRLSDETSLRGLRQAAKAVLNSFGVETLQMPGVNFRAFRTVVPETMPHLFDGFNALFEHFLFDKDFDLSKKRRSTSGEKEEESAIEQSPSSPRSPTTAAAPPPLLPSQGEILDYNILSQLSLFIPGEQLFRSLQPLYAGSSAGFSMGSFEKAVFFWQAPTILLVTGSLLPSTPSNGRERAFADILPTKRFPNSPGTLPSTTVTYGAYIPSRWKHTHRTPFGDDAAQLFQLQPTHDLFRASTIAKNYATFVVPPSNAAPGINFGSPLHDEYSSANPVRTGMMRRSSFSSPTSPGAPGDGGGSGTAGPLVPLGAVSLYIDDGLEYAVFTHAAAGGGSYHTSTLPGRRNVDWQDRFEIDAIEVWGVGGDVEAERQRKALAWEEREARLRKEINLGGRTGDLEADRELLRLAGLVGHGESGGSMG